MKRFIYSILVLFIALPAAAQVTTASIGGRIVDDNGPVEGVTVVVIHQPSNTQYYTTTNARGWYQLSDVLPGGPYTVRIHYFSYKPLTVRELYTYAGQHSVIDANLEAGTTDIHVDDAATSLRIGENLGGGVVPVAPGTYDLVSQRVYTAVPFDVRQEAALDGVSRLQMMPVGANRFHGSAYGYFGSAGLAGATVSTPLFNEDYVLFGGLQYDFAGDFSGAGRIDARLGASNRLDLSGGRLAGENWAMGGFTSQIGDGRASNRLQAGWTGSPAYLRLGGAPAHGQPKRRAAPALRRADDIRPIAGLLFYPRRILSAGRRPAGAPDDAAGRLAFRFPVRLFSPGKPALRCAGHRRPGAE